MTLKSLSTTTLLAAAIGIPGCVVYDNNCDLDEKSPRVEDTGGASFVDDDGEEAGPLLLVDPDTVEPGETLIAAVVLDPGSPEHLEFNTVTEVRFSAGIAVCSEQARDGELLLSLVVDEAAVAGPVDLMLVLESGERVVVEDAVDIIDPGLVGSDASDEETTGEDPGGDEPGEDDPGGFVEDDGDPAEEAPERADPCR